jgi:sialate O-acetylesterase
MKTTQPVKLSIVLFFFGLFFLHGCQSSGPARLELLPIFGDNMVLQQQQKVPVWGIAAPKASVTIQFGEQKLKTKADKDGKWKAYLEPMEAGFSDDMTIVSDTIKRVFKNVVVGEVWLCSGQSNMEMNVACSWAKVNESEKEVANANFPLIRLFIVDRNTSVAPLDSIKSSGWQVCSPQTVGGFSAVGYFFGRDIHQKNQVPVGLIQSAWGGTLAEAWTSSQTLGLIKEFAGIVDLLSNMPAHKDSLQKHYENSYKNWLIETALADVGIDGQDTIFARPGYDDSGWLEIIQPSMWEGTVIGALDGVVWFRKKIHVPANQIGKTFTMSIAPPDDADETWVNGVKIGESKEWNVVRHYKIPTGVIKPGENIVTVRLFDFQGGGGFMGQTNDFCLYNDAGWKTYFGGKWLCKPGFNLNDIKTKILKPDDPNRPTVLYNAMINPIAGYGIKGAIWYQGESNAGRAFQYRDLFPKMIQDWRNKWQQGDFPFLFVQLANFMPRKTEPAEDAWAELREAQAMALGLPNTGMAVSIDIGDANDIHPSNKQDVGKRLALAALKTAYGQDIPFSGPMYRSSSIDGNKVTIEFEYFYKGLSTRDGKKPVGFAIAGEDRKFFWADAEITENKVIVFSKKVPNPKSVRYAWASNPECNLVNSAGLPASPFRTDNWPGLTVPDGLK